MHHSLVCRWSRRPFVELPLLVAFSLTGVGWLSWSVVYKSRMTFVESSPKTGWLSLKALRKKYYFCWKLYGSRMTFIESSPKAGWLSSKALWKPLKKRLNYHKIAYVGSPFFHRRPWHFGERHSRAPPTPATLVAFTFFTFCSLCV